MDLVQANVQEQTVEKDLPKKNRIEEIDLKKTKP